MENKKGKVLELVVYLAILIAVILLSTLGKIPKPKEIKIEQPEMIHPIMERVQ